MPIIYQVRCDGEDCETMQEIEPFGGKTPEYLAEAYGWKKVNGKHYCGECQKKEKENDGKI
jgi:hypothetical protein